MQEEGPLEHTKLPRQTELPTVLLRRGEAEVKLRGRLLEGRKTRREVGEGWDRSLVLGWRRRGCRSCTRAGKLEEERERGLSRRIHTVGSSVGRIRL